MLATEEINRGTRHSSSNTPLKNNDGIGQTPVEPIDADQGSIEGDLAISSQPRLNEKQIKELAQAAITLQAAGNIEVTSDLDGSPLSYVIDYLEKLGIPRGSLEAAANQLFTPLEQQRATIKALGAKPSDELIGALFLERMSRALTPLGIQINRLPLNSEEPFPEDRYDLGRQENRFRTKSFGIGPLRYTWQEQELIQIKVGRIDLHWLLHYHPRHIELNSGDPRILEACKTVINDFRNEFRIEVRVEYDNPDLHQGPSSISSENR